MNRRMRSRMYGGVRGVPGDRAPILINIVPLDGQSRPSLLDSWHKPANPAHVVLVLNAKPFN